MLLPGLFLCEFQKDWSKEPAVEGKLSQTQPQGKVGVSRMMGRGENRPPGARGRPDTQRPWVGGLLPVSAPQHQHLRLPDSPEGHAEVSGAAVPTVHEQKDPDGSRWKSVQGEMREPVGWSGTGWELPTLLHHPAPPHPPPPLLPSSPHLPPPRHLASPFLPPRLLLAIVAPALVSSFIGGSVT